MNFERILGLMAGASQATARFKSAYDAGFDAGTRGSNCANSHFAFFSTREQANEWERGKAAAERQRGVPAVNGSAEL